jgi:hypothetical protein
MIDPGWKTNSSAVCCNEAVHFSCNTEHRYRGLCGARSASGALPPVNCLRRPGRGTDHPTGFQVAGSGTPWLSPARDVALSVGLGVWAEWMRCGR